MKRGSFGMPKRGNLRKKTDEDRARTPAREPRSPAIVIPTEKTKSKKKGKGKADGGMAASLLSFDDEEAGADTFQVTKKPPAGDGAHRVKKKSMRAPDALEARRRGEKGRRGVLDRAAARARQRAKTLTARPAEHMDHNAPANGRSRAGTREPIAFMPPPPRPGRDDDFGIDAAAIKAAKAKRRPARAHVRG